MKKVEDNEARNGGALLCDLCRNKMYILSEYHENEPWKCMNISRFDHSTFHKDSNILTIECGLCNILRGAMDVTCFLDLIDAVVAGGKGVKKFRFLTNLDLIKKDAMGMSQDLTAKVMSEKDILCHFEQIQEAQLEMSYVNARPDGLYME